MAETTTDHVTIKTWAQRHKGKPAAVERTHFADDVGIIRIMFPDNPRSEHDALVEISWHEFFKEFEDKELGADLRSRWPVQQDGQPRVGRAPQAGPLT